MKTNRNKSLKSDKSKSKKSNKSSSIRDYLEHIDKVTLEKLFAKNQQLKDDLKSSYKDNQILRTRLTDYEKDMRELKENQVQMQHQIQWLQKMRKNDSDRIRQQDDDLKKLKLQIRQNSVDYSQDNEMSELRHKLDKVIDVKLKYERIIKAMADKPELKPVIADILERI